MRGSAKRRAPKELLKNLSVAAALAEFDQDAARTLRMQERDRVAVCAFARRLVATTDRAFTGVTSGGVIARLVRLHIVPLLVPQLFKLAPVRRLMFLTISQTTVDYRGSSLSEGRAGEVCGGDRLPWVETRVNGVDADNFKPLTSIDWQIHVYGDASLELRAMCDTRKLPLQAFPWSLEMERVGLSRNAAYLVRPDGYVAVAEPESSLTKIASFLDSRGITQPK